LAAKVPPYPTADAACSLGYLNRPMMKTTKPMAAVVPPNVDSGGLAAIPTSMPSTIKTKPIPSHLAPVRVTLACDFELIRTVSTGVAIGAPQPGHDAALSDTCLSQSEHLMSAIASTSR